MGQNDSKVTNNLTSHPVESARNYEASLITDSQKFSGRVGYGHLFFATFQQICYLFIRQGYTLMAFGRIQKNIRSRKTDTKPDKGKNIARHYKIRTMTVDSIQ